MSKKTSEAQSEYFREWYRRKKEEDPEFMARRNAKLQERRKTDAGYRAAIAEYQRKWYHAKRDAAGLPRRAGRGSIVPVEVQRERANAHQRDRYNSDPEYRTRQLAATRASLAKRLATETPEEREHRLAVQRRAKERYKAKRKAQKEVQR